MVRWIGWRGFTLIELMVVIAIVAILAVIAIPNAMVYFKAKEKIQIEEVQEAQEKKKGGYQGIY